MNLILKHSNIISIDENIRGGLPCLRNTRISVSQILCELSSGESIKDIADDMDLNINELETLMIYIGCYIDENIK